MSDTYKVRTTGANPSEYTTDALNTVQLHKMWTALDAQHGAGNWKMALVENGHEYPLAPSQPADIYRHPYVLPNEFDELPEGYFDTCSACEERAPFGTLDGEWDNRCEHGVYCSDCLDCGSEQCRAEHVFDVFCS